MKECSKLLSFERKKDQRLWVTTFMLRDSSSAVSLPNCFFPNGYELLVPSLQGFNVIGYPSM